MILFSELPKKYVIGLYYPGYFGEGEPQNPNFTKYTQQIIDLRHGSTEAVNFFEEILNEIIDIERDLVLIVPPTTSGIKTLAQRIEKRKRIIDATNCWQDKYRIKNNSETLIKNNNILLIDDVVKTGNTMTHCTKALLEAKAKSIKCITLSKVISGEEGMDLAYNTLKSSFDKKEKEMLHSEQMYFAKNIHNLFNKTTEKHRISDFPQTLAEIEKYKKELEKTCEEDYMLLKADFDKAEEVIYGNGTFTHNNDFMSCFLW